MWFKGKRSASILVETNNKIEESVFLGPASCTAERNFNNFGVCDSIEFMD